MASPASDTNEARLVLVEDKLQPVLAQAGLEPETAKGLLDTFRPLFSQANELCSMAANLTVTDATQVTEIKQARAIRLELRAVRIEAEKKRKLLKEDSLRRGKAIDGVYHVLEYAVVPVEERLLAMEEFAERAEATRKAAIKQTREEALRPYGVDTTFINLGDMNDAQFASLLESTRLAHEAKLAAAKKAEEERIAREKAEAAERARVRLENERLRQEAEAREKEMAAERERAAKEKAALEEKARQEKADADRKAKEAAEKAAAERRALEEKARQEAESRVRAEFELRRKKEAEEAEKRRKEREAKRADAAPDREKLEALAKVIATLPVPEMATASGRDAVRIILNKIRSLRGEIERIAAAVGEEANAP